MFEGAKPEEGMRAARIPSDFRQGAHPQEGVRPATILRELRLCAHPQGGAHDLAPLCEDVRSASILRESRQRALPPEGVRPAASRWEFRQRAQKEKYMDVCVAPVGTFVPSVRPVRPRPSTSVPSVHVRPRPSTSVHVRPCPSRPVLLLRGTRRNGFIKFVHFVRLE